MNVCDQCSEQEILPESCDEDGFKKVTTPSPTKGIKVVFNCFPVKSFQSANRSSVSSALVNNFSFCSKNCLLEYIKKNLDEEGNFKYKAKDGK